MGFVDTIKQVMKGRSEMVERGIDTAVEKLGRFSTTLEQKAQTVKEKARALDEERAGDDGAAAAPLAPAAGGPPVTAAPPGTTGGSSLRGDLVGPDVEQPSVEESIPPAPGPGPTGGMPPA